MAGQIHRLKKEKDFAILDKRVLQDKSLSWKAKGLHSYLMQLPDAWQINISDLEKRSTDGRDSTAGAMKELIQRGYVVRVRVVNEKTKTFIGYDYHVHELPINGKAENGFSVNGKAENGKPVTIKKEIQEEINVVSISATRTRAEIENLVSLNTEFSEAKKEVSRPAAPSAFDTWVDVLTADYRIREGFTITQKIPGELFEDYVTRFSALARTQPEKYNRKHDLTGHFLNWSRIEYQQRGGSPSPSASQPNTARPAGIPKNIPTYGA